MISNSDSIIDSREIEERIEELQSERAPLAEELATAHALAAEYDDTALDGSPRAVSAELALMDAEKAADALTDWDADNAAELAILISIREQAEGYAPDWRHGATLIHEDYFKTYAEELADDIGALDVTQTWPLNCIDWAKAADLLKQDYTSVDFDGTTYWVR